MARSFRFKEFVLFLSSIRGDIANVTAPPFFLAPQSFLEGLKCFTERPALFSAPALETDPDKRAMLVVKWWLSSLKAAFYVGQNDKAGIRKPLNPFLGELWFGDWQDETNKTSMIVEQVSHHPPITACYMWDEENGIRGEGYTRVEMTFSGFLNVKQTGHAILHIDRYNENHLLPLPSFQVRGFMGGHLYPEITATYHVVSSSGFTTEVQFLGRGLFSGVRNSFRAQMYRTDDKARTAVYKFEGQWNDKFEICHVPTGSLEMHTVDSSPSATTLGKDLSDQDPWESRKAWAKVHEALQQGDMQATIKEKSKLEQAQRDMRKKEKAEARGWDALFFSQMEDQYTLFHDLTSNVHWPLQPERTKGVWKFDHEKAREASSPYRNGLTPLG
ncbi:hypothetical protein AYL99_00947 [Fonsecaea erecta]|uniref:Oxysterol-binding protein n=1 Tax=Fonsecaea erecta TaxID=1367422 RepID=A0A179A172_9EURO|nr:hypothetical protein AYL99_00947 [Fonsecaea erecta]OAP64975.1 hypothetical protein AYL99_00947 [Fonsecaea erecta]